jgi:CYTH domain-containing protein
MALEHERKFLLKEGCTIPDGLQFKKIYQNYIEATDLTKSVRVRIEDDKACCTFKAKHSDITNYEFEEPMRVEVAMGILQHVCNGKAIHKKRFLYEYKGHIFEIDEFYEENEGLVLIEVETVNADTPVELPSFVGKEVTSDYRYSNSHLSRCPFTSWK